MKTTTILTGLLLLLTAMNAQAGKIASLSSFDKEVTKCLQTFSADNRCVATLIKDHLPDGNDAVKPVADQVEEFFLKWLDKEKIANVYPVNRKAIGDFIVKQDYVIEDGTASIILLQMTYRRVLGDWYVLKFNINSKPEYIADKLGY